MKNADMLPDRFLRWHRARCRVAMIREALSKGYRVMLPTYTRAPVYDARHVDHFRATRSGAYVKRGRSWDCIDFSNVRIFQ